MPILHPSVAYCDSTCDQIVVALDLNTCQDDDCMKHTCEACTHWVEGLPTCSEACAAKLRARLNKEAA